MLKNKKVCISVISAFIIIIVVFIAIVVNNTLINKDRHNDKDVVSNSPSQSVAAISDNKKITETLPAENASSEETNFTEMSETSEISDESDTAELETDNNQNEDAGGNSENNDDNDTYVSEATNNNYYNNNNSSNKETTQNHIVYNDDGTLNIRESYWENYKGFHEFRDAISTSPEFSQLLNKAAQLGIPVSKWSLTFANYRDVYPGNPQNIWYFIYYEKMDYYYRFEYDGNNFYFTKQGFMNHGRVGGYVPEEFENNIVYREDGILNLQESYWHYEDSDDLYRSITSTPEFKQAINGYRSVTIRYPNTDGKITAKLQQWIVGYPDGSEYHFLFDGTKYCRMHIWSD